MHENETGVLVCRTHDADARTLAAAALARLQGTHQALTLIEQVLDCRPLGEAHAAVLEAGTGIPAAFWLACEADYRDGLAAGLTDPAAS